VSRPWQRGWTAVRGAAIACWEFVAGDDPVTALGVIVALGVTALLGSSAWWVMPVAALLLLVRSLWTRLPARVRAARPSAGLEPPGAAADVELPRGGGGT
jgi:hypothetical protein